MESHSILSSKALLGTVGVTGVLLFSIGVFVPTGVPPQDAATAVGPLPPWTIPATLTGSGTWWNGITCHTQCCGLKDDLLRNRTYGFRIAAALLAGRYDAISTVMDVPSLELRVASLNELEDPFRRLQNMSSVLEVGLACAQTAAHGEGKLVQVLQQQLEASFASVRNSLLRAVLAARTCKPYAPPQEDIGGRRETFADFQESLREDPVDRGEAFVLSDVRRNSPQAICDIALHVSERSVLKKSTSEVSLAEELLLECEQKSPSDARKSTQLKRSERLVEHAEMLVSLPRADTEAVSERLKTAARSFVMLGEPLRAASVVARVARLLADYGHDELALNATIRSLTLDASQPTALVLRVMLHHRLNLLRTSVDVDAAAEQLRGVAGQLDATSDAEGDRLALQELFESWRPLANFNVTDSPLNRVQAAWVCTDQMDVARLLLCIFCRVMFSS